MWCLSTSLYLRSYPVTLAFLKFREKDALCYRLSDIRDTCPHQRSCRHMIYILISMILTPRSTSVFRIRSYQLMVSIAQKAVSCAGYIKVYILRARHKCTYVCPSRSTGTETVTAVERLGQMDILW